MIHRVLVTIDIPDTFRSRKTMGLFTSEEIICMAEIAVRIEMSYRTTPESIGLLRVDTDAAPAREEGGKA